jgi:formate dehydrogenase
MRDGTRRRARSVPKGRQVEPGDLDEIRRLLGDRARRRDLLIEFLHLIQDAHACIPTGLLAALAQEMRLSFAEVFEVATFYAHFEVTDTPAAGVRVRVCDGIACALQGAEALAGELAEVPGAHVVRVPCIGRCDCAPAVQVGAHAIDHASVQAVAEAVAAGDIAPRMPAYIDGTVYREGHGYGLLARLRRGTVTADAVLDILDEAKLAGLGGAGFPTARKWRAVRGEPAPRLLAVNADEGEPGTFKDRFYLERDPHRFLEGILIAAEVVQAAAVYVYVRDEYPEIREILRRELANIPPGGPPVELRRGAGAYICGEESAMIESIEGKRGLPRHKPPLVFQHGLFGRPTLVNNVETLWWVRDIVERGAEWWAEQGRRGRTGLRSFSVSGRVRHPGVKLAPAGISAAELIDEFCGGMAEGHVFRAYLPGGASGGFLPASLADLPLDFGCLEPHGCFIGSAAVVVLSDADDLKAAALNLMRFFRHESCGQCTPCRLGTEKAAALMAAPRWDAGLLAELSAAMRDASICGLGQAAPNPVLTLMRHFPEVLA